MRLLSSVLLLLAGLGCAVRSASALSDPPRALAAPAPAADAGATSSAEVRPAPAAAGAESASLVQPEGAPDAGATVQEAVASDDDSEADDEGKDDDSGDVGESHDVAPVEGDVANRYTADIDDGELARRWKEDPASLGSISFGFTDEGRLLNGEAFPA